MNIKGLRNKLVIAQMAIDGMSASTIVFYSLNYKLLEREDGCSCVEMARGAFMSPQAARRHINRLESKGYIERQSYRVWRASSNSIKDQDFLSMLRYLPNGAY